MNMNIDDGDARGVTGLAAEFCVVIAALARVWTAA